MATSFYSFQGGGYSPDRDIETALSELLASCGEARDAAQAAETAAAASQTAASNSEAEALAQAAAASASEANAAASGQLAADWAEKGDGLDVNGLGTRSAKHHANQASASATAAATSASNALTSETIAQSHLDNFLDKYLGSFASSPTLDNEGNPLSGGELFFSTDLNTLRYYNGTSWVAISSPSPAQILSDLSTVDGSGSGIDADLLDGQHASAFAAASHTHPISEVTDLQSSLNDKLNISSYTATDVLAKLKTVDGAGSGIDADLLDGLDSTQFIRSDVDDEATGLLKLSNTSTPYQLRFDTGGASTARGISWSQAGQSILRGVLRYNEPNTRFDFYTDNGLNNVDLAAQIVSPGTGAPFSTVLMTREKGDNRYLQTTGDITVGGNIMPDGNNTRDIGSDALEFRHLWLDGTAYVDYIRLDVAISGNGVATQAEAEAGTINDHVMTPLNVAQAITAQTGAATIALSASVSGNPSEGAKVGCYGMLAELNGNATVLGETKAGSALRWASVASSVDWNYNTANSIGSTVGYGTWRALGESGASAGSTHTINTLWVRIA